MTTLLQVLVVWSVLACLGGAAFSALVRGGLQLEQERAPRRHAALPAGAVPAPRSAVEVDARVAA